MGNGPLQVGATAARARALISPLLKARTAMLAAWPPPIITKDSPENIITYTINNNKCILCISFLNKVIPVISEDSIFQDVLLSHPIQRETSNVQGVELNGSICANLRW